MTVISGNQENAYYRKLIAKHGLSHNGATSCVIISDLHNIYFTLLCDHNTGKWQILLKTYYLLNQQPL